MPPINPITQTDGNERQNERIQHAAALSFQIKDRNDQDQNKKSCNGSNEAGCDTFQRGAHVALQLRALCGDHPVDEPLFDEIAPCIGLPIGRVVAENDLHGQLVRRGAEHPFEMFDYIF